MVGSEFFGSTRTNGFSGYAPSYATPAPVAGSGSGLLGTGLAVAGGMAAGMLAERMFEGRRESMPGASSQLNQGGLVPGMFDEPPSESAAAPELEERPIDTGGGDGRGRGDTDAGSRADTDGW